MASFKHTPSLSVLFVAAVNILYEPETFLDAGLIYNVRPSGTSADDGAPSAVMEVHSASPPGSTYPNISAVLVFILLW